MKKIIIALAFGSIVFVACGKRDATIVGSWVQPVPGMDGKEQGFKLEDAGKASSINMETLKYEHWRQLSDTLVLSGKSIGNGVTSEFADTLMMKKLTADSLILSDGKNLIGYKRIN